MNKSIGVNKVVVVASNEALAKQIAANLQSDDADAPRVRRDDRDGHLGRRERRCWRASEQQEKTPDHLDGVIWASDAALAANKPIYYGSSVGDFNVIQAVQSAINRAVQHARMAQRGVPTARSIRC